MVDIALCALEPKPLSKCKTCTRNPDVTQPEEKWQSYMIPSVEQGECGYFWDTEKNNATD
jgi:hypothetical protein